MTLKGMLLMGRSEQKVTPRLRKPESLPGGRNLSSRKERTKARLIFSVKPVFS
jgi:hypothetical protein